MKNADLYFRKLTLGYKIESSLEKQDAEDQVDLLVLGFHLAAVGEIGPRDSPGTGRGGGAHRKLVVKVGTAPGAGQVSKSAPTTQPGSEDPPRSDPHPLLRVPITHSLGLGAHASGLRGCCSLAWWGRD